MLCADSGPAIAAAFGLGGQPELVGPVARGQLGQVWRLTTSRGRFAVKDPFFDVDPVAAAADADYQDILAGAGVPLPPVIRSTAGTVLYEVHGVPVRVYGWIDVLPPDRRLDPESVGAVAAAIHRVRVPTDVRPRAWDTAAVGESGWRDVVDRLRAAQAPFAPALAAMVPELVALESLLRAPTGLVMCHRDLWADNLRATARNGGAPIGIAVLDWENAGSADPVQELPMLLFEFGAGDLARQRRLLAAYRRAGGNCSITGPGDVTMLVAQLHHLLELHAQGWLAATEGWQRQDREAGIREFLDEPVDRRVVDRLVAVGREFAAG